VDVAVFETIKALVDGKFTGGYRNFGLAEDGVGYAENDVNRDMIAPYKAKLDELRGKIISGEIVVPTNKAELATFLQKLPK